MLHTKGPWFPVQYANYWCIQTEDSYSFTDVLNEETFREAEANATLAAAAPEMLETLIEAKEVLTQLDHRHNGKCYNPTEENCSCTLCKINNIIQKFQP